MDFCHCPLPELKEANGGQHCETCFLPYDHNLWLNDPRVKMAEKVADELVDSVMAVGRKL